MPRKPPYTSPRFITGYYLSPSQRKRRGVSYNYKKKTNFGRFQGKYRIESSDNYMKNMMGNTFGWIFSRPKKGIRGGL